MTLSSSCSQSSGWEKYKFNLERMNVYLYFSPSRQDSMIFYKTARAVQQRWTQGPREPTLACTPNGTKLNTLLCPFSILLTVWGPLPLRFSFNLKNTHTDFNCTYQFTCKTTCSDRYPQVPTYCHILQHQEQKLSMWISYEEYCARGAFICAMQGVQPGGKQAVNFVLYLSVSLHLQQLGNTRDNGVQGS